MLIQAVFVEVLYQLSAQTHVLSYLLIVLLSLVCQADFVGNTNPFKILDEFAEVNISGDEVALTIKTFQFFGVGIDLYPGVWYGSSEGFKDQSIGVIPYSDCMLGKVNN